MFNAYEETINVPLVVSNPAPVRGAGETDAARVAGRRAADNALAGRGAHDLAPDGLRGRDLTPILAAARGPSASESSARRYDLGGVLEHPNPAPSVQDAIHFTYDDHQAATAPARTRPGQPNRIRAIRTDDAISTPWYFDPPAARHSEHELYDLERDPERGRQPRRGRLGRDPRRRRRPGSRRASRAARRGDGGRRHHTRLRFIAASPSTLGSRYRTAAGIRRGRAGSCPRIR